MYLCPAGHHSAAADYCDNCGRPIPEAGEPAPQVIDRQYRPSGPNESSGPNGSPDHGLAPMCRFCATPFNPDDAFCEGCGHERPGRALVGADAGDVGVAESVFERGSTELDGPVSDERVESTSNTSTGGGRSSGSSSRPPVWTVRVLPDHDYFLRVLEWDGPDARHMQFPHEEEVLTLTLTGESMRIGRRNSSVTSAPPEIALGDPGVSRRHAMLLRCGDGTWEVMDLGSANGTTINGGYDRVRRDPVRLDDGDRVHVGAWTTLEIRRVHA